ncbi:DNA repair protein RecO [Dysgonomonas sp. 520]|uniref:DNA repair protein RecO n=1 Tax=Dysgonomonas sp. 520 TaxID=2302931 RepID=UPI0013D35243|nr:DNA repair protein RecO [Dysgonomonas sp. 520]
MQHKINGIVLNTINYNDKYILVQVYTEQFGRVTYMVSKAKSKSSKFHRSFFSPLTVLNMEVEHQTSRSIQRIKECRIEFTQNSIAYDMTKTSIVFFLSEFLSKILKEADENPPLYKYLRYSLEMLESSNKSVANFHLVFMLKLTRFLGFYPNLESYATNSYFDLMNGEFCIRQPLHNHYIKRDESFVLSHLARISFENMHHFQFSRNDRTNIINRMLEYYRIHLHDFPALKSLDILHELF